MGHVSVLRDISPVLLRQICKDIGVTVDEFCPA
jgi:hypothetical protein